MKVKTLHFFPLISAYFLMSLLQPAHGTPLPSDPLKAISITVSGRIMNDSTGKPIKNHGVTVKVPYIGYSFTTYTDTSGNYADTIHVLNGLGDTLSVSTYDCHNILHIQSQPIQSYSILINFSICETFSPLCHADFVSELDSSSVIPDTYTFLDLSTGNPDHWSWDFGDGLISTDRNPVHTFSKSGHYKVCLSITRENLKAPCFDSSCSIIYTSKYFSIGGHVFAGDHPINNPVSNGDTGIAYLYKLLNSYVIPFDTLKFTYLGYFSFPHLLAGDYFVKVTLTPGSPDAKKYTPTYYIRQAYWQQSQLLGVSDTSIFNFDIYLTRSNDSLSGPGRISGKVEHQSQSSGIFNLYLSEVLLLDSLKNIITYTLSDASGNFSFPGIPYGNYLLFVESAGKFSKFTRVRIGLSNPAVDTLLLDIFDHNTTGINEIINDDVTAGFPYPNPVSGEKVNIRVNSTRETDLVLKMFNTLGQTVVQSEARLVTGQNTVELNISGLKAGPYYLKIRTSDDKIFIRKLIVIGETH